MQVIIDAIGSLQVEQQSEWNELQLGARDPLDTLDSWTSEHRSAVRFALADYACSVGYASKALASIASWSRRMGVALSCVVAREGLRYITEVELVPRIAIQNAENWVHGLSSAGACRSLSSVTYRYANNDSYFAASSTKSLNSLAIAEAGYLIRLCARSVAIDVARAHSCHEADAEGESSGTYGSFTASYQDSPWWADAMLVEDRRLCGVVAESLRTGSVREWIE